MQEVGDPSSTDEGMRKEVSEGSREGTVPRSSGLRNYIKEETLAIPRDRRTNGNEIGENITIIKRESRHGLYVSGASHKQRDAQKLSCPDGWR
ncbi:MAG: hypothetical protein MR436_08480 [Eubacterium sp.]|nr:hypothetical protein [Eubacterium sp.]